MIGPIGRAFLDSIKSIQDRLDLDEITALIARGQVEAAVALVAREITEAQFQPLAGGIGGSVIASGNVAAANVNSVIDGVNIRFNALNPETARFVENYAQPLIRELLRETREAVREVLQRGIQNGIGAVDLGREVRGAIGLTRRQNRIVENFRRELETFHNRRTGGGYGLGNQISRRNGRQVFVIDSDGNPVDGITERRLRDFRYDKTLARAMREGAPLRPEQIDRMVEAYRRKMLRNRGETIAVTESRRALSVGQHELFRQQIQQGAVNSQLVRREWIYTQDGRTRHAHREIPGLNPDGVGMDRPFISSLGPIMYPGDPNAVAANTIRCRCSTFYRVLSPEVAERLSA